VNDPPESARRNEATVYDWLGQFVIVNYTRGPAWDDINDPFDIARGPLEGRESPFFLQEVSSLGIMVQRPLRKQNTWGPPVFLPWGSVHAIRLLELAEEPEKAE
jgi:hypothetical protein